MRQIERLRVEVAGSGWMTSFPLLDHEEPNRGIAIGDAHEEGAREDVRRCCSASRMRVAGGAFAMPDRVKDPS